MRIVVFGWFFLLVTIFVSAQEQGGGISRGSIPEELLRPRRGESPRYPIDTVIGELGQGSASNEAFAFANRLAAGLLSGNTEHPALVAINYSLREDYISVLESVEPRSYRLGGGREEPDGAISFMIRFLGRDRGITGELFIRYVTNRTEEIIDDEVSVSVTSRWTFEDLILEAERSREEEHRDSLQRFDFSPYERFF
jgi:hypothetical protein